MSTFGRWDCVCDELGEFSRLFFGVGVANFIFRRRVAFIFRVTAAYVMGGAIFGGFSTLCSGAVFDGCTGRYGCNVIVRTLGSDAGSFFSG